MFNLNEVQRGMPVMTHDGHKLGKVIAITDKAIVIEQGRLFHHDYLVELEDIREVLHGEVVLHHGKDSLFAPKEISREEAHRFEEQGRQATQH